MSMVDRIVARIEEARLVSIEAAKDMYYGYFKVSLYRKLYQADVDDILTLDGYTDCIMSLTEINTRKESEKL